MAGTPRELLESLVNHITLPPRLPGGQDRRPDIVGRCLVERLLFATGKLSGLPHNNFPNEWKSLCRSLEISGRVNSGNRLTKTSLLTALQGLQGQDFIAIHIAEQNAALIIRIQEGGESVLFEAFEASPLSEDVLASKNALRWDFPGSAVAIPISEYQKAPFQYELATFLEKASTESIKRFAAHTTKAGSFAFESRDTVDPSLITEMLMTLLEANGRRVSSPLLHKRVRDDVCWSEGGENPWRRCPFWLVLRVAVHRHLSVTIDPEVGRMQYKFLICLAISGFLDEVASQINLDLVVFLKTKLCRRLVKLEAEKDKAPTSLSIHYESWLEALGPDFRRSTNAATEHVSMVWGGLKKRIQRPILTLPKYADPRHLVLSLRNSTDYIQKVLNDHSRQYTTPQLAPFYKLPQDYQSASTPPKPGANFANRYFGLSEIEAEIESRSSIPDPKVSCDQRCIEIAKKIKHYLKSVGDVYDDNPEQKSIMLLTVMELWVEMDACAVETYGLLKEYNPGIPSNILNTLQIAHFKDMCRLHKIREYLKRRHTASKGAWMTIFNDPGKGCFGERYYTESADSSRLQSLHERIETIAEQARIIKEQELVSKTSEFEKLAQEASIASCLFTTDEFLVKIHDDKRCQKCYLDRKVRRFNIAAHEHPLPENPIHAKVVLFELSQPHTFAAYRDCTWQIIYTLMFPATKEKSVEPQLLLDEYSELKPYMNLRLSQVSLASTTKSFLATHYSNPRLPVGIEDVCLPSGLKFKYFDTQFKVWPGRLMRTKRATFSHHCPFTMPANSPLVSLNLTDFAMDSKEPSSYDIVASQSKCPPGISVHEYMSFQTLFSGKRRRWLQILVELGSSNINFSTEATTALMAVLSQQIGPEEREDPLGVIHGVFQDEAFCKRLTDQLDQRLDGLSSNWRETNCMETLITIAQRLFELSDGPSTDAIKLLEKARAITSNWISTLRSEIQASVDPETSQRCSRYAFWASLLCRRTFAPYRDQQILEPSAFQSFIECSISLQDNMDSNIALLPWSLKNALVRDFKMVHRMRFALRDSLKANQDSLMSAITAVWPNIEGTQPGKRFRIEFLPEPNQWWAQITIYPTSETTLQTLHFHLLEGHLLVMGKPIGKLPPEWRKAFVLQQLFGNQSLLTYPSSLPGMTYVLAVVMYGHRIHLGFRNGEIFVRARVGDATLELIPPRVFGNPDSFDLPASLVDNCVHWLDLKTRIIEIRHPPNIWKSKPSNWLLDFNTGRATRRTSTLVDPYSPLFQRIARTFLHFEGRRYLTALQPSQGRLTVELRRLELTFFVNGNNLLESPQLRSEIDPNQDAGTWYGLNSKLIVRQVVKMRDPVTHYWTSVPQRQRSILVPMGEIKYIRRDQHISLFVANTGDYGKFTINEVLGRLDCPAEPRLLYLKAMYHAYTSFVLPDPLTSRTGTEEALHCLKSGYCQPWTPITPGPYQGLQLIARLTPRREYYPKNMRLMQTTFWDPHLTTTIQHDGYRAIVDAIVEKSQRLSVFSPNKIELAPLEPAGDDHLTLRSRLRRQAYQRQNADSDGLQVAKDEPYVARDRWRVTQRRSNVIQCTNILRVWPSSLPLTRDLAGILQNWGNIGGYTGSFDKALLTDLLDVQWATDWGSLVNLCRESSSEDVYKLMFLFAIISFRHDVAGNMLNTLIAFVLFQDLKALAPPAWSAYTRFRHDEAPSIDNLLQLMKPSLVPYSGDMRSTTGFNLNPKLRKKFESAELAHKKQQEVDSKLVADFLLKQWPCETPTIAGLPASSFLLVNVEEAFSLILPEWLRLFQNWEHSCYVTKVQNVLDFHHGSPSLPELKPALVFANQEVLSSHTRNCTFPTLQDLLMAAKVEPGNPILSQKQLDPFASITISHLNLDKGKTHNLAPALSPEMRELETIIGIVSDSKSVVRRQYGNDLLQSLKALQQFRSTSQKQQPNSVSVFNLATDISQAQRNLQNQLDQLRKTLEKGRSANWLHHGGLWPSITPVAVLESLRSTSNIELSYAMKSTLLSYAQSITALQRLLRIEDAMQNGNTQRQTEEQQNLGHSNWKPVDYPDWLLLEIDSNILIRPGQIDVALAIISPDSMSNSVLQMNMGQGKTSCIMPMAAAVLADGKNLLRIVVPKPLLLQTAQLLQTRLGGLLGRDLTHVPFSRKTSTTSPTIEEFYKIHRETQKTSGILLALPEHILSFMLSGLQRLSDGRIPEAKSMIKVQNWLNSRSRDVLDECDNILALRTQLIYPSGSQKTVDGHPHRWEIAEALLGRVDSHLQILRRDYPRSIEVIWRQQGGFPVVYFLRKDVEDALISRLVDDIYLGRTTILPESSKSDGLVIKKFISEAKVSPEVMRSISKLFPDKPAFKQAIYLLRGLFIHRILLMTLKKRWNVQYGLHPTRDPIAVPYDAKGSPSEQAEWGHPDVAILFTCLAFYYDGLSIAHLQQTLEHVLKSDDPFQIYDRFAQNSRLPGSLRDWNAINVDDKAQLKEIWQHVRYNVIVIDYFLNNFVFPRHAKQFQVKLQGSGWDIPLFSTSNKPVDRSTDGKLSTPTTTGFSGTNDWKGMLPLTISQHDLPGLSHTNAEVLTYLLQPRNRKYILAANARGNHMSEHELLEKISREGIRVLIDAGAQILEMDNFSLAKAWLEISHEPPAAVYFDKNNKAMVLYRQGHQIPLVASPFADDLSDCLVYVDEAHTRGTDLKMPTRARGALTLGPGQTKDHTVQAAMRLRQLGTTQSITFFAPPEVHQSILYIRKKQFGDLLCSYDVVCWLLEQTCSGIEQLQPLYYSQGADFCRRAQAALDHSEFDTNPQQREAYLGSLRQVEDQTLDKLYGPNLKAKSSISLDKLSPKIAAFMKELNAHRKEFRDTGNAVRGSALQEVEQERESTDEVEAVREVQKPVHHPALKFPGLHRDIISFVKTGRLAADSAGYEPAFFAMMRTAVGRKYGVIGDSSSGKLYVSTEFTRTVNVSLGRPGDQFQRPVNWILWSNISQESLIVIPEEAENILLLVKGFALPSPPVHLLTYSAPITRKMLHFNDLQYYAVPSLPSNWKAPLWLLSELGIYSGRLYFGYTEYNTLVGYLTTKEETSRTRETEHNTLDVPSSSSVSKAVVELTIEPQAKAFTRRPLTFLQEWLAVRRKDHDFSNTPMGFLCQGKQLLETHAFFLPNDSQRIRKKVQPGKAKSTSGGGDEADLEGEAEFGDEDIYGEDSEGDVDDFNDAELDEDSD